MASALKKIKLTPANELFTASSSLTQETMVTSTPRRCFEGAFRFSSISPISSDHATGSSSNTSGILAITNISDVSSVESEDYGENYDDYFDTHRRVPYKGPIWKNYKPITEDNLYAKILQKPSNTESLVTEFLFVYNSHPDVVIKELIQLCVDVAGFQHFNAKQIYRVGSFQEDSKHIVKKLESYEVIDQQTVLEETGRYLLMERSTSLVKYLRMGLYSFLQNLIEIAHKMGLLYDDLFMKCFTVFIRTMEESQLKCIRHTGVVFAVKILTAIVLVFNNIVNNPYYQDAYKDKDKVMELNKRKDKLQSWIPFFYFIFYRNCRIQDPAISIMRLECIREVKIWTKYFPTLFVSHFEAINMIIRLISDPSRHVRLAALEACGDLVGMTNITKFLRPIAETLIRTLLQRFYDVNIDVSVKAINICTYLLEVIPEFVTHEVMRRIKKLVFDEHAPIGKAACNYLLAYFHKKTDNPDNVLLAIATILIYEQEGDSSKELLVEGFLYSCEQMQNWELFCKFILSDKINDQERRAIAEIFTEAVKQRLKGKPTVRRLMSKNIITVDPSTHQSVAEVLGVINIIISQEDDIQIIINMLKIIVEIYNNFLEKNFCREYSDISETVFELFNNYSDEDLLTQIADVLKHLSDIPDFAERGRRIAKILYTSHANQLKEFLKEPSQEENQCALKVAILYKNFNLNDLFSFAELTDPLEDADSKTVSYLLICCKWYLIWALKTLAENNGGELQKSVMTLLSKCRIFSIICFNLFQHDDEKTLILEVFSTVCNFYNLFTKELKFPMQLNTIFKDLEIKIDNPNLGNILAKVLEENVICSKILPLKQSQMHVIDYIEVIQCGVLPPQSLVNVFKYFYSYNKEYGHIIKQSLTSISKHNDINMIHFIVMETLTSVYEKILGKHGAVELRSEEGVQLKLLAKQFATFNHFHERRNLFKLLCIIIDYAFIHESNLIFLCFMKCFVVLLKNDEDRRKIKTVFNKKVAKEYEKNDAVLYFAMVLNSITVSKDSGKFLKPVPAKKKKTVPKENQEPKKQRDKEKSPKPKKATKTNKKVPEKIKPTPSFEIDSDSTSVDNDDMTIHDTESDGLEEPMTELTI